MRELRITAFAAVLVLAVMGGCRESKPPEPRTHGAAAPDPSSDAPRAAPEAAPSGAAPSGAAPKLSTPDKTRPDTATPAGGDLEACVDRWLRENNLNQYGDPPDTMYAGGTPLFDESTGQRTDRLEYVLRRHPHAKVACSGDGK